MEHDIRMAKNINLAKMEVKYDNDMGSIYLDGLHYVSISGCENILDFKRKAVNDFNRKIDDCIGEQLGMTFPYTVGNITFNSLSEINGFILGTQVKSK